MRMPLLFLVLAVAAQAARQIAPPAEAPRVSNVPMTDPKGMLASHELRYGHGVAGWVELADGRILMVMGDKFLLSADRGVTWLEPFEAKDRRGQPVTRVVGLVRLSGQAIGLVQAKRILPSRLPVEIQLLFRRSQDDGRTWSEPVLINTSDPRAFLWQDVPVRTSSGRIILPVYTTVGPTTNQIPGAPYTGGYLGGNFIRIQAHFFDPRFCSSYVYYSDDEGKTWERNRNGELVINLIADGRIDSTAEPSVAEVVPGKLLMLMRTRLGRLYQSWSMDNGTTWGHPQPTQLASTQAPAQVRTLPASGHLLIVFTQQGPEEIRRGFIRTRLSSAISRNRGGVWEHFQNIESLHPETRVEPGPIAFVRPEGAYSITGAPALENDARYSVSLPPGYGDWSYPSVLVLKDRVLVGYPHQWRDATGAWRDTGVTRLKVLPLRWLYGSREPSENPDLKGYPQPVQP